MHAQWQLPAKPALFTQACQDRLWCNHYLQDDTFACLLIYVNDHTTGNFHRALIQHVCTVNSLCMHCVYTSTSTTLQNANTNTCRIYPRKLMFMNVPVVHTHGTNAHILPRSQTTYTYCMCCRRRLRVLLPPSWLHRTDFKHVISCNYVWNRCLQLGTHLAQSEWWSFFFLNAPSSHMTVVVACAVHMEMERQQIGCI